MSEVKTIGITGGIGSGKSYISALMQREFEIPVYDCDSEAKRLTAESEEIRTQLVEL
ncbi:MAG: dephospho-CoA kinase, partial [Bacteroidaceae bacterium]|nr:dephospho-CoA kinase [Bacteroidaceae bacterium]